MINTIQEIYEEYELAKQKVWEYYHRNNLIKRLDEKKGKSLNFSTFHQV